MPEIFGRPSWGMSRTEKSSLTCVELWIVPEYALLIERHAPFGRQVLRDPGAFQHPLVQRHEPRVLSFQLSHRLGEGVAQAGDHLE